MRWKSLVVIGIGAVLVGLPARAQMLTTLVLPLNAEGGFAERHRSPELPSVVVGLQHTPWSWAAPMPISLCGTICIAPGPWRRHGETAWWGVVWHGSPTGGVRRRS